MSLSNFEYQEIMQMYEDRRLSNYHLHEQRKKEIYQKIPRIRDLDRQMAANSVALGRKLIAGDDPAVRPGIPGKLSGSDLQLHTVQRYRIYRSGEMPVFSAGGYQPSVLKL